MRKDSVQPELDSQLITDSQLYRYSRQIIIPEINEEGQELLLNSKVAIIGAGGLGCPVALYLGGAGVGEITIVDDDIIDISNLNRQIAFKTNSVGSSKSKNLKFAIQDLNPEVIVNAINERLTSENLDKLFQNQDLIIDCTDNYETRLIIAKGCCKYKIPMSFGSAVRQEGQTAFFQAKTKKHINSEIKNSYPCYICVFPTAPEDGIVSRCSETGILGPITGLIASIQSLNVIRYLTNQDVSRNLILWDGLTFFEIKTKKMEKCEVCS
ncbi:MAG: molybdopterin-synthase adenylyltransferase MoeB [SAR116 cluster bacterium]|nr:molybdopterin-synthase adenylyltransferase MoeB [SAR116 cluster bacterium]